MFKVLAMKSWPPSVVGAAIGALSWFAFATADQPIGITTAFEQSAALTAKLISPENEGVRAYESAKAREGEPPRVSWEWFLVVGVLIGSAISARLSGDRALKRVPSLWEWRFGGGALRRLVAAFAGGALMMIGARMAGGCTSGHGISGALQLAVSSWAFAVIIFATGVVTAFLLYGREGADHV